MSTAWQLVLKHKRFFIALAVVAVLWQLWLYYRALQLAKAAGQGFGEGAKGTVTGVASILTAPGRILATAAASVVDWLTAPPSDPGTPLSYDPGSGRFQAGDVSISPSRDNIPGTVTYPWSRN